MPAPVGSLQPGEYEHRVTEEALAADGFVLSIQTALTAVDGKVKKATATYYIPFGINVMASEDPTAPGTYIADIEVAIAHDGVHDVQLALASARSTSIEAGDLLAVYDAGKVCHITDSPLYTAMGTISTDKVILGLRGIVGIAEEAVLESVDPADGKIKCRLSIR
jgi:hypothetical protein